MQAIISWRHLEHSKVLEDRINTKLAHLEKFSHRISQISIILTNEGARNVVELKVELDKAPTLFVKEESYKIHEAIDNCIKKSERQLKEYERKVRNKKSDKPI